MSIQIKRAQEHRQAEDGYRVLVDRTWPDAVPEGVRDIDAWMKELAPSAELRRWFDHDPGKWPEFKRRYFRELESKPDAIDALIDRIADGRVTLVSGSREGVQSNAAALKEFIERQVGA